MTADGDEPDWRGVVEAAKQDRLGVDDDAPVAKGDIIAELRSRGFTPGFFDRAVEKGVIKVADEEGVVPKYEFVEDTSGLDIAEYDSSEEWAENTIETKPQEENVFEAFETAVEFMRGHLDDPLPEECNIDAETPREYFEDIRGWDSDTVEEKRLGYAPASPTALLDEVMEEGYTREEILATGLFYEGLTPHFQGRVVLPYFDDDGKPCYAISRSVGHPDDPKKEQKYTKAVKTKKYSRVDEPIYGLETLEEETDTVLVAEGIADAITVQERGHACISPVTTQFKKEHHDVLLKAVEDTDASVVVVADNDAADSDIDDEGRLEVQQHGEGLRGALRTADFLSEKGVDAQVALPPTVAHHNNDLDEYLSDDWGTLDQLVAGAKPPQQFDAYDAAVNGQNRRDGREKSGGDTTDTSRPTKSARHDSDNDVSGESGLFDLTISEVLGVSEGYRGENPLGHDGGSRKDYFVVTGKESAYDHKRKVGYTPLTALLVDAGERPVTNPRGELSDAEVFAAWKYAKEREYIPEGDPIPRRALHHVAETATEWGGELVEHGTRDGETFDGLPRNVYNVALRHVEEEYGLNTGRRCSSGGEDSEINSRGGVRSSDEDSREEDGKPIAAIPNNRLDLLREDERKRTARRRGFDVPSTEKPADGSKTASSKLSRRTKTSSLTHRRLSANRTRSQRSRGVESTTSPSFTSTRLVTHATRRWKRHEKRTSRRRNLEVVERRVLLRAVTTTHVTRRSTTNLSHSKASLRATGSTLSVTAKAYHSQQRTAG